MSMVNLESQGFPHYAVTYEGRVFSLRSYRFLKPIKHSAGYNVVHIGNKLVRIHRLVQQAFDPIDNPDDFFVNHIDGVKDNNHKDNLEWSDPKHNAIHSVRTGLNPTRGFDEPTIHMLCKMLEDGMTSKEISEATGVDRIYINKLNAGQTAKYISNEYNLNVNRNERYSLDKIVNVCEYLQERKYTHKEISELCNCHIGLVRNISNRRRHKSISSNYEW